MKKILFSILLLVTVSISARAQFILGLKGGTDFSKMSIDNLKASSISGYQAGIFMRAGNSIFFQPEIYLSSSGSKFTASNIEGSAAGDNNSVRFTNVNLPLLFGTAFGPRNLNFRLLAGPVYTIIADKNRSFSQSFMDANPGIEKYVSNTLGYQGGIGGDVGSFTIDLRYEGGLTQINKDYSQKQNQWSVTLGFKVL